MTVTRIHRYRLRYMTRRPLPTGNRIVDLFQDHHIQCVARSASEAVRRFIPVGALVPQCVREHP